MAWSTADPGQEPVGVAGGWRWRGFVAVARWRVAGRFAALRLAGPPPTLEPQRPALVLLTHPGWWDPLVCALLAAALLPGRRHAAAIAAESLARWPALRRLGFIAIDQRDRAAGARALLRAGGAALAGSGGTLWLTAQGRFADPRERPLVLAGGLARLAARHPGAALLPLALEYPFWTGPDPEALARFGAPLEVRAGDRPAALHAACAAALTRTADELAALAVRRAAGACRILVPGRRLARALADPGPEPAPAPSAGPAGAG